MRNCFPFISIRRTGVVELNGTIPRSMRRVDTHSDEQSTVDGERRVRRWEAPAGVDLQVGGVTR